MRADSPDFPRISLGTIVAQVGGMSATTTTVDFTATLRTLEGLTLDAAQGYTAAARACTDPEMRELLAQLAIHRRDQAEDLRKLINHPFEDHVGRSFFARVHRALIEARARLTHGGRAAILAECERGESVASHRYEQALQQPLPSRIASVLREHLRDIRDAQRVFAA